MADEKQVAAPIEQDGLSVKEAAKSIESLLSDDDVDEIVNGSVTDDDEEPQPKSAAKKDKSKPKREEPDPDEDEDEPDDEDDDDDEEEVDDEEVDDEGEPEVDEEEEEPAPSGRKHRVKVDGEDIEVTHKELLAGYSRNSSFTKKSQALAEEKRAFEATRQAKVAEVTAAQEHYVNQLAALEESLASDEPDWETVRRDNPEQFADLHAAWQIHERRLGVIRDERAKEEAKIAQTQLANHSEFVKGERAKLIEAIPEWGDKSDKGAAFRRAVRDYGIAQGFGAQELEGTADHRAFKILHKAFLYDQAQAKVKADREKGKKKVDAIGQIKPGAKPAAKKGRKAVQRQQDTARLKKSGNVRDAATLIESMLD